MLRAIVTDHGEARSNTTWLEPVKSLAPQFPEEDIVQLVIGQLLGSVLLKKSSQEVKDTDGVIT